MYIDSSALVKNYLSEVGSTWINQLLWLTPDLVVATANLTLVEVTSAIVRRRRGGQLTAHRAQVALEQLAADWSQRFVAVTVPPSLAIEAAAVVQRHGLRGYDAIHVAVARSLQIERTSNALPPLTFVSADVEQLRAATAEGLATDNPDSHP